MIKIGIKAISHLTNTHAHIKILVGTGHIRLVIDRIQIQAILEKILFQIYTETKYSI